MAVRTEADIYLLRVKKMSKIILDRNKDLLYLDGGYKDLSINGYSEYFNSQVLILENKFRDQTASFNKTMEYFDRLTLSELVDIDKQLSEILVQLEIPIDVLEMSSELNKGGYFITSSAGSIVAVGKSVTYRLVEVLPHISSADNKYEYNWYCENDVLTRDSYSETSSSIATVVKRNGILNWFDNVFGDPMDITIKAAYPGIHDIKVDVILDNKLVTTAVFRQTVLESIDEEVSVGNDSVNSQDSNGLPICEADVRQELLRQKVDGVIIYPNACKYFAAVNSLILQGVEPDIEVDDLAKYVNSRIGDAYTDVLEDVFPIVNVTYEEIPTGKNKKELIEFIGDQPAMVSYPQRKFWGKNQLNGNHGVSFENGTFDEPYIGRSGSFAETRSGKSVATADSYNGGFKFYYNKK